MRELIGVVHRLQAAAETAGRAAHARRGAAGARAGGRRRRLAPPATVRQAADVFFLDDEKIVWEWPDVAGRLVEELR